MKIFLKNLTLLVFNYYKSLPSCKNVMSNSWVKYETEDGKADEETDEQTDGDSEEGETIGRPVEQRLKNTCNDLDLPFLLYLLAK